MYRAPQPAPASTLDPDRRGPVVGRFCHGCGSTFSVHQSVHKGKGIYSKDHIASPCAHEGDLFAPEEEWWEEAVEVMPAPAGEVAEEGDEPT
jgi:hypothetical protein